MDQPNSDRDSQRDSHLAVVRMYLGIGLLCVLILPLWPGVSPFLTYTLPCKLMTAVLDTVVVLGV